MTDTEELRRLLDERGVEYETDDTQVSEKDWYYVTYVKEGYGRTWVYVEPPDCDLLISYNHDLTPQQAIDATLGRGECKIVEDEDTGFLCCSECGAIQPEDYTVYYCWCCGAKVVDA